MMSPLQPHIILLMADHLRRDCLSCYGSVRVDTPHLDALADESVVFEDAYCATPLCTPTRCSMYTGKWPHTHGAIVNGHNFREDGVVGADHETLYERLSGAGYGITQMGVHHCRTEPPLQDRLPDARFLADMEYGAFARRQGIHPGEAARAVAVPNVEFVGGRPVVAQRPQCRKLPFPYPAEQHRDVYWSHRMAEEIERLDFSSPQYVEALFWAPHPPLEVPEPYYSMYPEDEIELPATVGRWQPGQPATLLFQSCGMMGLGRTREEYREGWSAHLGLVTMVDECLGRVIDALKTRGVWEEALVVFVQDHGDMLGCHHLTQKHCFYEEAAHIPLLVKPPSSHRVVPGRRVGLTSAIDYCPTICDYAATAPPAGVQGRSLRPHIEGPATPWRDAIFMEYNGDQGVNPWPMRAIVADCHDRRFKYTVTCGDVDELYDLSADPSETESLVSSPEHAEVRESLRNRLRRWMLETGDIVCFEDCFETPTRPGS